MGVIPRRIVGRWCRQRLVRVATAIVTLAVVEGCSQDPTARPDAVGVRALLDVMDTVAALHPDFAGREVDIAGLQETARDSVYGEARARNEASAALGRMLDAMFATETYRVYFRRFPNVTPEIVREVVLDLPYRRRSAPGGIGDLYYALVRERDAVRGALARLLDNVDMTAVYETAEAWLPAPPSVRPIMYLIYDSNAGSFAAEGKPFLNLYSSMDLASLGNEADAQAVATAQGVMAHELHHVLADSMLYPATGTPGSWQAGWVDRLTRGLVGEGVANHCNPPAGVKKAVYEDPLVVSALLRRLGDMLVALRNGTISEEGAQAWYRANYFDDAEALLRQHLAARVAGDSLEAEVRRNLPIRPDVEHALGWWMTSRISDEGARRDAVVALLAEPYTVYERYNAAVPGDRPDLRIAPEAIAAVRAFRAGPG